jgi:hypothetical protein
MAEALALDQHNCCAFGLEITDEVLLERTRTIHINSMVARS